MLAGSSCSMLSHRAADLRLGCAASLLWRKQCSRVRFALPSSNLEHVVVPEPSCFRVLFCYLACRSTEFVGSYKMCNLVSFEVICNGKNLVFWVVILYSADVPVVLRFLSSFYKDWVVMLLVRWPFVASWLMSSFCSNVTSLPFCWMDKSEICPLNYTIVWICAFRHFSYVGKWTVVFSHHVLTGLVGRVLLL